MVGHQRGGMESLTGNVAGQIRSGYDAMVLHPLAPKISAITDAYSMELRTARSLTGDPLAQVSPNWIATTGARSARDLERQVSVVVSAFGDHTVDTVTGGQRDAADLGVQDAHALLKRVLAPVRTVGVEPDDLIEAVRGEAKQALVGRSIGGGHLTDLIANLGPQAGDAVHRTLLAGLSTGENPRELANLLYGTLSNNLSRSLTIARTEMLNTYRSAQLENFRANSDVVSGWYWTAGVGACIMCLEMSGTLFPLDAELSSHPNCGCSPTPTTRSWDDILSPLGIDASGIEETSYVPAETGDEWFQRQDAAFQRETLGPAAFNAWTSGNLDLKDLVGQTEEGDYYQRSLKELGIDARDYLGKNAAYLDREVVVGESSRVFSAVDSASSGSGSLSGLTHYALTPEDHAFVQSIREQIPAEGITSHTDAIALGAQLRDRVEGTLTELKRFAEEEAAIYTRAPNLTDAERAWAFGEKDAIAAHNGVRWTQAKVRFQEAYQSQMAAYLGEIRSLGGVDVKLATEAEAFDAAVAERIATAKEMLPSDWLRASNDMGEITPIKWTARNSAGSYRPDYSGAGTLAISYTKKSATGEMESTALHEMIHRMEQALPGLSDIEGQFYAARTAGEEYVLLTNGIKEMTKLDDWLDQYLGRRPLFMGRPTFQLPDGTYKYSTRSYELLSMGVEMLFAPGTDAATFALREDDQFVAFVLGVLMGVVAPPVAP